MSPTIFDPVPDPDSLYLRPQFLTFRTKDRPTLYKAVCRSLAQYGIDGSLLYQRIKNDKKEEPEWVAHADCPICYNNEGLHYILACPCKKKIYSKDCLTAMAKEHETGQLHCPFCRKFTVMLHIEWVFCLDEEGRRKAKRVNDRVRTREKKKRKKQEKREQRQRAGESGDRTDLAKHSWASSIKRVHLILPPPPSE